MTDLQAELESEFEETEAFVVDSDPKAQWALRKLRRYDSEVARIHAAAEHERSLLMQTIAPGLAQVQEWEDRATKTALSKVGFFRGLLFGYFDRLLKQDKDLKTYKLPGGTLERRTGRPSIVPTDIEATMKWIEALPADDPRRDAIKRELRTSYLGAVSFDEPEPDGTFKLCDSDGELIPGVVQVVGEEKFDVKLEADEDEL